MASLLFLLIFFALSAVAERSYLSPDRHLHRDANNPDQGPYYGQPEQIHLAYGGSPDVLTVTWLTFDDTNCSVVEYGFRLPLDKSVPAKTRLFVVSWVGGDAKSWRNWGLGEVGGTK
jgi:hypothetical protein